MGSGSVLRARPSGTGVLVQQISWCLALLAAAVFQPDSRAPHLPSFDSKARPTAQDTVWVEDDTGTILTLERPAHRIVSLVPALTEVLFAIGAGDRLVGRTRFDRHPSEVRAVRSVGDGIRPNLELIVSRKPDLVVVFAGPDNGGVVAELHRAGLATLAVKHNSLADLERNTLRLGALTGCENGARTLIAEVRLGLREVRLATADVPVRSVYYDVWPSPIITIGRGSYLDSLLTLAGGRNVFGDLKTSAPQVSLESLVARDPDVILWVRDAAAGDDLAPQLRPGWRALRSVRRGQVRTLDADLVDRLGPRVAEAARELARAVHPEIASLLRAPAEVSPRLSCKGER